MFTPLRSAIQQRSRAGSWPARKAPATLATSASKRVIEAVFLGIQRTVSGDDPADVAGAMLAQQPGRPCGGIRAAEQALDAAHGGDQRSLRRLGESAEQRADLVARTCIERRKRLAAGVGQRQRALAAIGFGGHAADQPVAFEALQDPAEIAGIESEFATEAGGGGPGPLRQFVEHARLGEREAASQQAFLQDADGARVEPVEPPDGGDAVRETGFWGLDRSCSDIVNYLSDSVN